MADPTFPANETSVFWSPALALDVLTLTPLPDAVSSSQRSRGLPPANAKVFATGGEHRLIEAGMTAQLLLLDRPVESAVIGLLLPLDDDLPIRLAAALDLWRRMHGRAPEHVRLTPARRRRLIDSLRALDARLQGASYRDIARALFPAFDLPSGPEWKVNAIRAQTMRLVADATTLMHGGYRALLRRGRRLR